MEYTLLRENLRRHLLKSRFFCTALSLFEQLMHFRGALSYLRALLSRGY